MGSAARVVVGKGGGWSRCGGRRWAARYVHRFDQNGHSRGTWVAAAHRRSRSRALAWGAVGALSVYVPRRPFASFAPQPRLVTTIVTNSASYFPLRPYVCRRLKNGTSWGRKYLIFVYLVGVARAGSRTRRAVCVCPCCTPRLVSTLRVPLRRHRNELRDSLLFERAAS